MTLLYERYCVTKSRFIKVYMDVGEREVLIKSIKAYSREERGKRGKRGAQVYPREGKGDRSSKTCLQEREKERGRKRF